MQRLTELETCLNQLTSGNVGIGRQAWATMAGPSDLLRRVLQETVQRIQQEPTAFRALDAALDRCHDSAKEATKYEEDLASAG